jgi:hypothetical protein
VNPPDTLPNPTSAYELRLHLTHDHGYDMRAAGWFELTSTHDHHHRVGADHDHEKPR